MRPVRVFGFVFGALVLAFVGWWWWHRRGWRFAAVAVPLALVAFLASLTFGCAAELTPPPPAAITTTTAAAEPESPPTTTVPAPTTTRYVPPTTRYVPPPTTGAAPTTTRYVPPQRTCTHDGRGHGYLGYNPGTHTHPHADHGPHETGKCAGV